MSLSRPKRLLPVQRKKSLASPKKRNIKYIIIAASTGTGPIYGAFFPDKEQEAQEYLEKLLQQDATKDAKLFYVSNLNRFTAKRNEKQPSLSHAICGHSKIEP